jgi:hypothetical protein
MFVYIHRDVDLGCYGSTSLIAMSFRRIDLGFSGTCLKADQCMVAPWEKRERTYAGLGVGLDSCIEELTIEFLCIEL